MKQRITVLILMMILLFLLYKFYPRNTIVETLDDLPLQFVVESVSFNRNQSITPPIAPKTIIQLKQFAPSRPISIPISTTKSSI